MKDVCLIGRDEYINILKDVDRNLQKRGFVSKVASRKLLDSKCVVFFVDKQFVLDDKCMSALDRAVNLANKNKLYYFAVLMQGNSFNDLVDGLSDAERRQYASNVNTLLNAFPDSKLFVKNNDDMLLEICYSLSIHGLGAMRKRFVGFTAFSLVLPTILLLARISYLDSVVRYSPTTIQYIFAASAVLAVILCIVQFILYRKSASHSFFVKALQFVNTFSLFVSFFSVIHLIFCSYLGDEPYVTTVTLVYMGISLALAFVCYLCVYHKFNFRFCYRSSDENITLRREKYDVFISYSHKDMDKAEELCVLLKRNGYKVLFDRSHMSAGDDWRQKAHKFIQSASCTVFVVSDNSVCSQPVAEELRASIVRKQSQGGYAMLVVSAYDDDINTILRRADVPDEVRSLYSDAALTDSFYLMSNVEGNFADFCKGLKDNKIRQSKFLAITMLNVRILVVNAVFQALFWSLTDLGLKNLDFSEFSSVFICIVLFVVMLPLALTVLEMILHALRKYNRFFSVVKSAKLFLTCVVICFWLGLFGISKLSFDSDAWWVYAVAIVLTMFEWLSPVAAFLYMRSRNRKYYKD